MVKITKTRKARKPNMGEKEKPKEGEEKEQPKPMAVGDPQPPSEE
jgi:hypothetical protein